MLAEVIEAVFEGNRYESTTPFVGMPARQR